jgi:hypothetical protein
MSTRLRNTCACAAAAAATVRKQTHPQARIVRVTGIFDLLASLAIDVQRA